MIFSLLLMQGISLAMFRSLVNQAVRRVDPLKFNFALGNTNETSSGTSVSRSTLLSNLLGSPPASTDHNNQAVPSQVPTPSPLVDSKLIDLITLIRAVTPPATAASAANGNAAQPASTANQVSTAQLLSTLMAATPILALPVSQQQQSIQLAQLLQQPSLRLTAAPAPPTVAAAQPQIIIVPSSLRASASEKVETIAQQQTEDGSPPIGGGSVSVEFVFPAGNTNLTGDQDEGTDGVEEDGVRDDSHDDGSKDGKFVLKRNTITKFKSKQKVKASSKMPKKLKNKRTSKSSEPSDASEYIVFDAVGLGQ